MERFVINNDADFDNLDPEFVKLLELFIKLDNFLRDNAETPWIAFGSVLSMLVSMIAQYDKNNKALNYVLDVLLAETNKEIN